MRAPVERLLRASGLSWPYPLKTLTEVIEFGASAEAAPVLVAMKRMPELLRSRRKPTADDIDETLVQGSWKRLDPAR